LQQDLFAEADDTLWISGEEEDLVRCCDSGKHITMAEGSVPLILSVRYFIKSGQSLPTANGLLIQAGTGFLLSSRPAKNSLKCLAFAPSTAQFGKLIKIRWKHFLKTGKIILVAYVKNGIFCRPRF